MNEEPEFLKSPPATTIQTGTNPVEVNKPQFIDKEITLPPIQHQQTGPVEPNTIPDPMNMFNLSAPKQTEQYNLDPINMFNLSVAPTNQQNPNTQHIPSNKYNIIDLFWLLNPKYQLVDKINPNETHVVIISYNISFGNMRISLNNCKDNTLQKNLLYSKLLDRKTAVALFPTTVLRILHGSMYPNTLKKNQDIPIDQFTCIEQIVSDPGQNWLDKRPICQIDHYPSKNGLRLTSKEHDGKTYYYDFVEQQYRTLLHACNWMVNNGFTLSGMNSINRQNI